MSMKVERSTLDQVKRRFELNKRKKEEKKKDYDFESRMQELREEVCGERSQAVQWLRLQTTRKSMGSSP